MQRSIVKAGQKFGRLTLTGKSYSKMLDDKRTMVEAVCECGTVRDYSFKYLRNGMTKSCGCYKRDKFIEVASTHHMTKHPLYSVYQDMMYRCYRPKTKSYPDYGARGITVCDDWRNDLRVFIDWGMANGYKRGLTLDRVNTNGNYEPDNCQFIIRGDQNKNTRRNRWIVAFGENKCLEDWGRDKRCKVSLPGLTSRINRGWDAEKAISTPPLEPKQVARKNNRMITAWGEEKCLSAWADDKRCTVQRSQLNKRLNWGWDVEKAISTPSRSK